MYLQRLHATLELHFANRAGKEFIKRGEYILLLKHSDSEIEVREGTWRRFVRPGSTIVMSALVRRRQSDRYHDVQMHICPFCQHLNTQIFRDAETQW